MAASRRLMDLTGHTGVLLGPQREQAFRDPAVMVANRNGRGVLSRTGTKIRSGWFLLNELTCDGSAGTPRPITRGPRFDCDRDVTETAGPLSEVRCHNVAKTGVDSGGLRETGGHNRTTGT